MPLINSPLPRAPQPRFYQGSSLRSARDSERPDRAWVKNRRTSASLDAVMRELAKIKQDFGRLRRRIVGGGGTEGTGAVDYKGEWSPTEDYKAKTIVKFVRDGAAAGTYISEIDVPAGISPDTGLPYWSDFPTPIPGMWG